MASIKEHLGRLNGKVATPEERFCNIQLELGERRYRCPAFEKVDERLRPLESHIIAVVAAAKTSASWLHWMWPVIWSIAGAPGFILLSNAAGILKLHQ